MASMPAVTVPLVFQKVIQDVDWHPRIETPPSGRIWASDGKNVWLIWADGKPIPDLATLVKFWTVCCIPMPPGMKEPGDVNSWCKDPPPTPGRADPSTGPLTIRNPKWHTGTVLLLHSHHVIDGYVHRCESRDNGASWQSVGNTGIPGAIQNAPRETIDLQKCQDTIDAFVDGNDWVIDGVQVEEPPVRYDAAKTKQLRDMLAKPVAEPECKCDMAVGHYRGCAWLAWKRR